MQLALRRLGEAGCKAGGQLPGSTGPQHKPRHLRNPGVADAIVPQALAVFAHLAQEAQLLLFPSCRAWQWSAVSTCGCCRSLSLCRLRRRCCELPPSPAPASRGWAGCRGLGTYAGGSGAGATSGKPSPGSCRQQAMYESTDHAPHTIVSGSRAQSR